MRKKARYWGKTGKTLPELIKIEYEEHNRDVHGEWLDLKADKERSKQITFWPEGSLIKTGGVPFFEEYEDSKHSRGAIQGFSGKAQRRMLEWVATLNRHELPIFMTLTYPKDWPESPETWKVHLDRFCVWLERQYANACQLWKLEPQERGAPHYHLMVWGAKFVPWQDVAWEWARIIHGGTLLDACKKPRNQPGKVGAWVFKQLVEFMPIPREVKDTLKAGVRVEPIRSANGTKAYIAKNYMGKPCDLPEGWGCVGRFWGIRGRKNAPKSVEVKFHVTKATWIKFRRLGRRFMQSKGYRGNQYSRILSDHPLQWVRALDLMEGGKCAGWDLLGDRMGPRPAVAGPGWEEWCRLGNVRWNTLDAWEQSWQWDE